MKNLGQVTDNQDIARKQDIPVDTNQLTNNAGFITSSAITGKVDKIASTDNAIARFDGTSGALQNSNVTITDAGKIIAPSFASDATEAGMVFSDNNELNFGSNSNTLYIGYRNKLNTSGSIGIYNFGTSSGSTGMTSGRINAGDIYSNGTKVATISDLSSYVPTSRTVNGKALSGNISLTASDIGALPSSTTIPTVNNGTITIKQNGTSKGTFTLNQSGNTTIELTDTDTNTQYSAGDGIALNGTTIRNTGVIEVSYSVDNPQTLVVVTNTAATTTVKHINLPIPTTTSQLTNDSGFITNSSLSNYLPLSGGTLTGSLTVTNSAATTSVTISEGNITASGTITCTACIVEDVEFYTTEPGIDITY